MTKTFRQYDSRWGGKNYNGSSTMAAAGCGPTSCADIIYNLDTKITPWKTALWMKKHGFAIRNNGTAWAGTPACLKAYGCKDVQNPKSMTDVFKIMKKDNYYAVFLFRGGSRGGVTWTSSGHYLAVSDMKVKNNRHYFYMHDPGQRKNDGWYCYETQMKGLVVEVWTCRCDKFNGKPVGNVKPYSGALPASTLRRGAKGIQVELLHDFLTWYGGTKFKTNEYGALTEKAVKEFQKKEGLVDDGVFGPKSLEKAKSVKK